MSTEAMENLSQLLTKLSTQELCDLKHSLDQEMKTRLLAIGANGTLTEEEAACVKNNNLIRCVKLIRDRTGLGLFEAKRYMDRARGIEHSRYW